MVVIQQNKQKVRPVLDFRELNDHMDPFTACADRCTEKLREWQRAGSNVSVLNLRKAYLQVRVHQSLWSYQTVLFKRRRYCLARMGFGPNVAPSIMQTGGARGVMVIVVGNGDGDTSSNPGRD